MGLVNVSDANTLYPIQAVQTANTVNVYYPPQASLGLPPPLPEPELGPLDWLRGQVDEVCELAMAA